MCNTRWVVKGVGNYFYWQIAVTLIAALSDYVYFSIINILIYINMNIYFTEIPWFLI